MSQEMRFHQEMARCLFEESNDAFFVFHPATLKVQDVNPMAQRITGRKRSELLQLTLDDIFLCADRDIDFQLRKAISSTTFYHSHEGIQIQRTDKEPLDVNISVSRIHVKPEALGLVVARDISERVRVENQRRAIEEQMVQTQKLESLGVLAGGIAHDFNNILLVILGNAEMAESHLSDADAVRGNLDEICSASKHAAALCRQMLAYSGQRILAPKKFTLQKVINDIMPMLRVAVGKTVKLEIELEESLSVLQGDPNQVGQIVVNLVTNASESMGGRSGVVRVSDSKCYCDPSKLQSRWLSGDFESGEYIVLRIEDDGSGIADDDLDKIFEPFYTTKFVGRGLGLAAVLGIMRSHKGAIHVESSVGGGTVFRLYFPASAFDATVDMDSSFNIQRNWKGEGGALVVDDELTVREVTARMLGQMGFTTLKAANGHEAMELLKDNCEDIRLIVMDMTMGGLDGLGLFEQLKELAPEVDIIISSGFHESDVMEQFANSIPAAFLQKPFTKDQLKQTVQRVKKWAAPTH